MTITKTFFKWGFRLALPLIIAAGVIFFLAQKEKGFNLSQRIICRLSRIHPATLRERSKLIKI